MLPSPELRAAAAVVETQVVGGALVLREGSDSVMCGRRCVACVASEARCHQHECMPPRALLATGTVRGARTCVSDQRADRLALVESRRCAHPVEAPK